MYIFIVYFILKRDNFEIEIEKQIRENNEIHIKYN